MDSQACKPQRPDHQAQFDHDFRPWFDLRMNSIQISKFKATCLASLERVRRTGQPLRVTRFGRPIADIIPAAPTKEEKRELGSMSSSMKIVGDIVAPLDVNWEAIDA